MKVSIWNFISMIRKNIIMITQLNRVKQIGYGMVVLVTIHFKCGNADIWIVFITVLAFIYVNYWTVNSVFICIEMIKNVSADYVVVMIVVFENFCQIPINNNSVIQLVRSNSNTVSMKRWCGLTIRIG